VIDYRETLWSEIYPGSRHTVQCLEPAVLAIEALLAQTLPQRKRTIWRLDGGSGSEERLKWILQQNYHLIAKGMSSRRAENLGRQVSRWHPYRDAFLGEVEPPDDFGGLFIAMSSAVQRRMVLFTVTISPVCPLMPKAGSWRSMMREVRLK
jgi:hypothetical protein